VKKPRSDTVQTAVRLPRDMLERLRQSERGVSEEIRERLARSLDEDGIDVETRKLMAAIETLSVLVRLQTKHDWHRHPAANRVFRHAITARLARLKPEGEAVFGPDDLPAPTARLVATDDVEAMGLGLEAIEFHTPPVTDARRRQLEEAERAFRQELATRAAPAPTRKPKAKGGKS
jgi:hypothetical protein